MFTFVFQPRANRENLLEFNQRLQEFCTDHPVVGLEAVYFGGNLIIQGTTADDADADGAPTFTATAYAINPLAHDLEEQLDGFIAQEMEKHKPEDENADPNMPMKFLIATGEKHSWAVIVCVNGVSEDGDDEGNGDTEPQPTPAAGFQGS